MKIELKDGPAVNQPPNAQAQSTRERAIARLLGQNPDQATPPATNTQQTPVANPNAISPEEMTAVKPKMSENNTNSDSSNVSEEAAQPKTATEAEKSKDTPLSAQFADLARKERALRAKVQAEQTAAKAREEALMAREEAIKAKESEYQSKYIPKDRLKADLANVLAEMGISYDDITSAFLNPAPQQDPRVIAEIETLKQEVQAQRKQQEEARKAYEEQQKRAYQQALSEIRSEATQLVNSSPEFETIKETGSVNDVVELIEKTYQKNGVLLTVEEAAKEVEEYLVEEALKIAKINKIRSKFQTTEKPSEPTQAAPQAKQSDQPQIKTLTNSVNASRKLSARERAIAAFKGDKV